MKDSWVLLVTHIAIQATPAVFAYVAYFQATKTNTLFLKKMDLITMSINFKLWAFIHCVTTL